MVAKRLFAVLLALLLVVGSVPLAMADQEVERIDNEDGTYWLYYTEVEPSEWAGYTLKSEYYTKHGDLLVVYNHYHDGGEVFR